MLIPIVNLLNLIVNVKSLELGFSSVKDALNSHSAQGPNDLFGPVMQEFCGTCEPQLKSLQVLFDDTKVAAIDLIKWFGENSISLSDGALERIFQVVLTFSSKLRDVASLDR